MKKKKNLSAYLRDFVMLIVLFAVVAVFAILGPVVADRNFLAIQNLLNILSQNAYLIILGIGITFIMLGGAMDLSTGFLISTVGIIVALVDLSTNFVLAVIVGLAAAVVLPRNALGYMKKPRVSETFQFKTLSCAVAGRGAGAISNAEVSRPLSQGRQAFAFGCCCPIPHPPWLGFIACKPQFPISS